MKREKRDPFMPTPEELRRAEDFLKALSNMNGRIGTFMFGAYAVGVIVLALVVLEWVSP